MLAIKMAVESPLLETTIKGATDVILNLSGDVTLFDANDAADYVKSLTGEDVNLIFGVKYEEAQQDSCTITVIATGLEVSSSVSLDTLITAGTKSPVVPLRTPGVPVPVGTVRPSAPTYTNPLGAQTATEGTSGRTEIPKPQPRVNQKDFKIPDFSSKLKDK